MDGFSQYKAIKKAEQKDNIIQIGNQELNEFYNAKREKNLDYVKKGEKPKVSFEYSADQLLEHFEKRNRGTEEDFKLRTEYYFMNSNIASAKAQRYQRLADNSRQYIKPFADKYSNRWTRKRKNNARVAAQEFTQVQDKMSELKQQDELLDNWQRYLKREEIMEHRMNAMCAAAVTKGKSADHEAFLQAKAKLSCHMLLMDQLEHLLEEEENADECREMIIRKLGIKKDYLLEKIEADKKEVKQFVPGTMDMWRNQNKRSKSFYKQEKKKDEKQFGPTSMARIKLLSDLNAMGEAVATVDWPKQLVLRDVALLPISKEEDNKAQWNRKYPNYSDQSEEAKNIRKQMELEAVERYDKITVPSPKQICTANKVYSYIMHNPRDYYELTKHGLPYYERSQNIPEEYKKDHPEFEKKVKYIKCLDNYFTEILKAHFRVETRDKGTYSLFTSLEEKGKAQDARQISEYAQDLTEAFEEYRSVTGYTFHTAVQDGIITKEQIGDEVEFNLEGVNLFMEEKLMGEDTDSEEKESDEQIKEEEKDKNNDIIRDDEEDEEDSNYGDDY